jgi:hypothetical protein
VPNVEPDVLLIALFLIHAEDTAHQRHRHRLAARALYGGAPHRAELMAAILAAPCSTGRMGIPPAMSLHMLGRRKSGGAMYPTSYRARASHSAAAEAVGLVPVRLHGFYGEGEWDDELYHEGEVRRGGGRGEAR